jgi:transglutaminase-like putative cysteine protease
VRYRVTHLTQYFYGELVPLCHNLVRLRPRDTAWQNCLSHELTVEPAPAGRRERVDFFGNHVTWVALQQAHKGLKIKACSEVDVGERPAIGSNAQSMPWDQVPAWLGGRLDADVLHARQYVFDSPHVPRDKQLADYARASFPAGAGLFKCLVDFTERIFKEFTFDTTATNISTPVLEVLARRRGVCQDFAHLAIGCLRSLGLPARYVSGYVATRPPPGKPRLVGTDASHAWISVFIPQRGWVDFDPTNGLLPSGGHITVGFARDYGDVSPVKGVMIGGDLHSLSYSVDVEPLVSVK